MSYYYLNANICIVNGAKYSAVYDFRTKKVYQINETSEKILQICDKETDERKIIEHLNREFNLTEEDCKYVSKFLEQLQNYGIISSLQSSKNATRHPIELMTPPNTIGRLWLELTAKCNLKCKHCYANAGKEVSEPLLPAEWRSIIDQADVIGTHTIQLIGGEPLLYPNLRGVLRYICKKSFGHIEIFTNGTLLDQEMVEILLDLGIGVKVSIYGPGAVVHDNITRIKGSFDRTLNGVELLLKADVNTRVAYIIMRENYQHVSKFVEFVQSLGVDYSFDYVRPLGRCKSASTLLCEFHLKKEPTFCFTTNYRSFNRNQNWNSCLYDTICIQPNGNVTPCIFEREIKYGNIREHPLETIYNGPNALSIKSLNLDKVEGCKDCEFRYACLDCRPLARATTGNLTSKNPRCTYNPYTGTCRESTEG